MTVFVLRAASAALKKFPRFNCSLDMNAEEIVIKHYYNIGVAVDTERGLIVPVIRDVDRKSIFDLGIELKHLAEKTRQGKADNGRHERRDFYSDKHRPSGRNRIHSHNQLSSGGNFGDGAGKIAACGNRRSAQL